MTSGSEGDARKFRRVGLLLERAYGKPQHPAGRKAVDVLMATILSQNTSDKNSSAGFRNLKKRYSGWEAVADAPVDAIEKCIRLSGLSRIKAPRIRNILRQLRKERGGIDLEFLRDLPTKDACGYLMRFDGVGAKTALCVLLFALERPVFPVDTHIYRVTRRLALLPDRTPVAKAHEVLTPLISPANRCAMHLLLISHGRAVCRARNPRCKECVLRKLCPSARGA